MKAQQTVLVVDDTELNINILLGLLDDYNVLVASSGNSALTMAEKEHIDLILLDILMPGIDGYETCRRLKFNPKTQNIPVIFSTAKTDEESIAAAYDAGGIDYVTKPFKPMELIARINTQLRLGALIEELTYQSSYDSLTEIYNRRKFFELADSLFAQQLAGTFALMVDIDNFKRINDTFGHGVGDDVIRMTANLIKDTLPENAIPGRLGGEEFAVVCNIDDPEKADELAESVRGAIDQAKIDVGNEQLHFTISLGMARQTENQKSVDELLAEADSLLYEAKQGGKNKVRANR